MGAGEGVWRRVVGIGLVRRGGVVSEGQGGVSWWVRGGVVSGAQRSVNAPRRRRVRVGRRLPIGGRRRPCLRFATAASGTFRSRSRHRGEGAEHVGVRTAQARRAPRTWGSSSTTPWPRWVGAPGARGRPDPLVELSWSAPTGASRSPRRLWASPLRRSTRASSRAMCGPDPPARVLLGAAEGGSGLAWGTRHLAPRG
jgi:hypothetical protein